MAEKMRNNALFRVCVDSAQEGHFGGRVFSRWLRESMPFFDLGGLVLGLEELMDAKSMPQAFQRSRSFSSRSPDKHLELAQTGLTESEMEAQRGALATFSFVVDSRLASSWQGEIDWLCGEAQPFASVLEFIRMVDGRLSALG